METNLSDDIIRLCEDPKTGDEIVFDDGAGKYTRTLVRLDDGHVGYKGLEDTAVCSIDDFRSIIRRETTNVVGVVLVDRGEAK
jgi:hypothetical protein